MGGNPFAFFAMFRRVFKITKEIQKPFYCLETRGCQVLVGDNGFRLWRVTGHTDTKLVVSKSKMEHQRCRHYAGASLRFTAHFNRSMSSFLFQTAASVLSVGVWIRIKCTGLAGTSRVSRMGAVSSLQALSFINSSITRKESSI